MQRFLFAFIFSTVFTSLAMGNSAYPDWILPELNRYPIETYLFDVGRSNKENRETAYKEAIAEARKSLSKKILKQAARIIGGNRGNVNYQMVLEHYSAVLEDYCSWHHASPALQLTGLKHRNLSVDNARAEQETFAIVYIEREKLKQIYANHVLTLHENIKRHLEMAKSAERDLNINRAIKSYLQTYPLYEAVKEAEIIQIGAEYRVNYFDAFNQLAAAATETNGDPLPHRNVIKRVEELNQNIIVNLTDIFKVVYDQITIQTNPPNNSVSIYPLMYEDSEMVSPFAQMFSIELEKAMPDWVFVDPMLEFDQHSLNGENIHQNNPPLRLSSSCWENGNEINIRVTLRDMYTGKFHASSVVQFIKTNIRDLQTYKPRGFEETQEEKKAFKPHYFIRELPGENVDEVPKEHAFSPTGGLKVDIWTDKGHGPLSYTEGERTKIYVRVNQPAYLRLLNIHPVEESTPTEGKKVNQKRALLKDNFYIGREQVNRNVEIGIYECSSPFGGELFVIAARTEKFPSVETDDQNGYRYLQDKDPKKAVVDFRGFKPITEEIDEQQFIGPNPITDVLPSFQQNEAQLTITTMERKK